MMKHAVLTVLSFTFVAAAPVAAQQVEKINPPGLAAPAPNTYSHIARAGKLVFIAGQVGAANGKLVGPGMKEQMEQALINLTTALKSQGATFAHVTKLTTYVTSITEYRTPEMAGVRTKYIGAPPPPNTLVQISQLADPAFKIEIEAIAVLP